MKKIYYVLGGSLILIFFMFLCLKPLYTTVSSIPIKSQTWAMTSTGPVVPNPFLSVDPRVKLIEKVFSAPINFYGKVVDQYGAPVPEADVEFAVVKMNDAFVSNGTGSPHIFSKSDSAGLFKLLNSSGASLSVRVTKKGYYFVEGKSTGGFGYGMAPDSERKNPPTIDAPAIFLLWKKGVIEPLVKKDFSVDIDPKKEPVDINLLPGNDLANIRVELKSEVIPYDYSKPMLGYDWSFEISIPNGGGLQNRSDLYVTLAPNANYTASLSKKVSKTDLKWRDRYKANYFVHFPGDYYGRILIEYLPQQGISPRVRITSYVNPKPGSRNLDSEDDVPYDY